MELDKRGAHASNMRGKSNQRSNKRRAARLIFSIFYFSMLLYQIQTHDLVSDN